MYKLPSSQIITTGQTILAPTNCIIRISDNSFIPFDPNNTDAKEFAKWLSKGGIPEPAVEGEVVSAEWITETIAKLLPAENT